MRLRPLCLLICLSLSTQLQAQAPRPAPKPHPNLPEAKVPAKIAKGAITEAMSPLATLYTMSEFPVKEGKFVDPEGLPYDVETAYLVNCLMLAKVLKIGFTEPPLLPLEYKKRKVKHADNEKEASKLSQELYKKFEKIRKSFEIKFLQPELFVDNVQAAVKPVAIDPYKDHMNLVEFITITEILGKEYLETRRNILTLENSKEFNLFKIRNDNNEIELKRKKMIKDLETITKLINFEVPSSHVNPSNNWMLANSVQICKTKHRYYNKLYKIKGDELVIFPMISWCPYGGGQSYNTKMYINNEKKFFADVAKELLVARLGASEARKYDGQGFKGQTALANTTAVLLEGEFIVDDRQEIHSGKDVINLLHVYTKEPVTPKTWKWKNKKLTPLMNGYATAYLGGWILADEIVEKKP
jgi:hypothetical protein